MMSFSQTGKASRTFSLRRDEHHEQIFIQARSFFLPQNTKEYRECHFTSTPCRHSSIDIHEVKQAIKEYCDKHFGVACWVEGSYERRPPIITTCVDSTDGSPEHLPDHHDTDAELSECQSRDVTDHATTDGEAESGQPSHKRRRVDHGHPNLNRPAPEHTKGHKQAHNRDPPAKTIDDFPDEFVKKVRDGLQNLEKQTRQDFSQSEFGTRLFEHRQNNKKGYDGAKELEDILKLTSKNHKSRQWLLDLYYRYATYRCRRLDHGYSKTGDIHEERGVKKKEAFCEVVSNVVNRLQETWGQLACLIYSALEVTKYRGSLFTKFANKHSVEPAVESIVRSLGKIQEVTLPKNTLVLNPAFFLSCVGDIPYSQTCKDIGLDRLASYDFQRHIDETAHKLKEIDLDCGKMPLSTFLQTALRRFKIDAKTSMVTIILREEQVTHHDSQDRGLSSHSALEWPRLLRDTETRLRNSGLIQEGLGRRQSPTEPHTSSPDGHNEHSHSGSTTPQEPGAAETTGFPVVPPDNARPSSRPSLKDAVAHGRELSHGAPEMLQHPPELGSSPAMRPASELIAISSRVAETSRLQSISASPPPAISDSEAERVVHRVRTALDVRLEASVPANSSPSSEYWSDNTRFRDRGIPREALESSRPLQEPQDSVPHSPALPQSSNVMPVDRLLDTSSSSPHMTLVQQQQVLESNQPLQFTAPGSDRALPENSPRELLSHSTSIAPNRQDQSEHAHTGQDLSACDHAPRTQNNNHPATPSVQEQAGCRAQMQASGFLPAQPESSQPRSHATEAAGVEAPEGGDVLTRTSSRDTPRSAYNNPLDDTSFWDDLLDKRDQASMDTLFRILDTSVVDWDEILSSVQRGS
ncbi:hypothetical protein CEP51_016445 [Fusarium floridanum]|uniref:Uncharacterized protein n=1 Tax=Fusarium floridanum TaxID=1325733 RepID=A0A428NPR8_9HYPO|nr:hypothetical protein CEP51_016445 [Fusarium floridanum]